MWQGDCSLQVISVDELKKELVLKTTIMTGTGILYNVHELTIRCENKIIMHWRIRMSKRALSLSWLLLDVFFCKFIVRSYKNPSEHVQVVQATLPTAPSLAQPLSHRCVRHSAHCACLAVYLLEDFGATVHWFQRSHVWNVARLTVKRAGTPDTIRPRGVKERWGNGAWEISHVYTTYWLPGPLLTATCSLVEAVGVLGLLGSISRFKINRHVCARANRNKWRITGECWKVSEPCLCKHL